MSQDDESNKLDELLIQWAEKRTPSDDHIQSITARIQSELRAPTVVLQPRTSALRPVWIGLLATAATMVLVLFVWRSARTDHDVQVAVTPKEPSRNSDTPSPLSNSMLVQGKSALFGEMQRVFDKHLAWVAETNDDVLFEVDAQDTVSQGPLMCIRLVLTQKATPATTIDAPRVWELDVIVRSEQMVHIASVGASPDLVLWPYVTNDGKVVVETQIKLPASSDTQLGHTSSQHTQTKLLSPDSQAEQGEFGANFVLSQSVVLLKEPAI